ncbi:MAG: UPF0280 family protein [Fervidobacterium sp.]
MKIPIMKRSYREKFSDNLQNFHVKYKYTDLWIRSNIFSIEMLDYTYELAKKLYNTLYDYIQVDKHFYESLKPIYSNPKMPKVARIMVEASRLAEVGPMASVAGTFAKIIGESLIKKFECEKVIIENGGDIYINSKDETRIGIFANFESDFNKVSLVIGPGEYGVCSSSGKIGHSLSFGNADIVVVVAKDAAIADAFATKFANMVRSVDDIKIVLEKAQNTIGKHIEGIVVAYNDRLGVLGNIKIEM